ncbi:MAG: helix-turn-helix transcriptional regulator [Treponema sp.]|nr:helix-turn-helix transcriptional regulator [Treponema sp.]
MQTEQNILTAREKQIFDLLLEEFSAKDIAFKLKIKYKTVDFHRNNMYRKLGVKDIHSLKAKYRRIISNSLASEEIPFIIRSFYNLPWAWTYIMSFPMFFNNKITRGDVYTFSYTFSSNVDFDLLEISFSDLTVGKDGFTHLFQGAINSSIKSDMIYSSSTTVILDESASSTEPAANRFLIDIKPHTINQPILTFSKFELIKQ